MTTAYDGMNVQSLGRRFIPFLEGVDRIQKMVSREAQIVAERLGSTYRVVYEAEKYATIVSETLPNSEINVSAVHFIQDTQDKGGIAHLLQLSVGIEGSYVKEQADGIIGKITHKCSGLGYLPANTPAIPAGSFARMG